MNQKQIDEMCMRMAAVAASYSYAERKKVGAIILTESGMLSPGFNGTIPGFPNCCEKEDGTTDNTITAHAEQNAMFKMLKEGVSSRNATLYVTLLPCAQECAKMVISAGLKRIVYLEDYRDLSSIGIFKSAGVVIEKYGGDLNVRIC